MSKLELVVRGAFDTVSEKTKTALRQTKEKFSQGRFLSPGNYFSDITAGIASRIPAYVVLDNVVAAAPDEKVLASVGTTSAMCLGGFSLAYAFGHSLVSNFLGDFYQKHSKKVDAAYSATLTFGMGMLSSHVAGYENDQALLASTVRAIVGFPLGPLTRYYTDSFRETRGEKPIAKITDFNGKSLKRNLSKAAAMILIPAAIAGTSLKATPADHKPIFNYLPDPVETVEKQ